jgi:hypothetical protein
MRSSILLSPIREVPDNPFHVVARGHEEVYSFELGLRVTVVCDRFNHSGVCERDNKSARQDEHTGDILLQDIELLENRA